MKTRKTYEGIYVMEYKGKCVCIDTKTMDVIFKGTYEQCTQYLNGKEV